MFSYWCKVVKHLKMAKKFSPSWYWASFIVLTEFLIDWEHIVQDFHVSSSYANEVTNCLFYFYFFFIHTICWNPCPGLLQRLLIKRVMTIARHSLLCLPVLVTCYLAASADKQVCCKEMKKFLSWFCRRMNNWWLCRDFPMCANTMGKQAYSQMWSRPYGTLVLCTERGLWGGKFLLSVASHTPTAGR